MPVRPAPSSPAAGVSRRPDGSVPAPGSVRATLAPRILDYARAHLSDPTLNAAQIAAEHHVSVRQLYAVLAEREVSLGDWIRTRRLEGSRTELAGPDARFVTIASVARRWGYADASTFGRLFRAAFGVSPREWRRAPRAA